MNEWAKTRVITVSPIVGSVYGLWTFPCESGYQLFGFDVKDVRFDKVLGN